MTPFPNPLLTRLWPGLFAWGVLYVSDYAFTLTCARLYRAGVSNKIALEGSFELNPYFQADIDSLKKVSPRFIFALVLGWVWLSGIYWITREPQLGVYEVALGAMILSELAIHIRHMRNLFLFREIANSDTVRGRIEYSRPLVLRMSSVELCGFAGAFALIFVFSQSLFTLGGAMGCLAMAWKHRRLARHPVSIATS